MASISGCVQGRITPVGMEEGSPAMEMISVEGVVNEKGLEDFMKLHECGVSYAIVSIMGPQSSGKSTLLNHLFHTNFSEMDASIGRGKTTTGIWIAKAPTLHHPSIMVMDVEGTDGDERGQDGTTFEKRSTIFSLVVADILFINMWCHDIGRENAANRPLLKTIFEVMMQICNTRRRRKATLHFIIRDKTKTPIEALEIKLRTDVEKIWETVPKTEDFMNTSLSEFFNVEVDALSHYEYATEQFKEEVIQLTNRILNSTRLVCDRGEVIPTSGLCLHVKTLWETIKENKQLDLPTLNEMVATVRCEEIAKEKLELFRSDKEWLELEIAANAGFVPDFGGKTWIILSGYLSQYDIESKHYEEGVRNTKRQDLECDAFDIPCPAYINTLCHMRKEVMKEFESQLEQYLSAGKGYGESVAICWQLCEDEFDKRCLDAAIKNASWDASDERKQLVRDIENHTLVARLIAKVIRNLNDLFGDGESFSWARIRNFVKHECDSAASALCSDIASFEMDQAVLEEKLHDLKQLARMLVVDRLKAENRFVLRRMRERYILSSLGQEEPFPQCLKVLSTMAVIRLDENPTDDDEVERLLFSALIDGDEAVSLDSDTWEEVPPEMILITPTQCKDIWQQFQLDIQTADQQLTIAESQSHTFQSQTSQLPRWLKLGAWVLGVAPVCTLLWRYRYLVRGIPTLPLGASAFAISLGASLLSADGRTLSEGVNACRRMMRTYGQFLEQLEEDLEMFHNFMMSRFSRNLQARETAFINLTL